MKLHKAKAILIEETYFLEVGKEFLTPSAFSRLTLEDFFFDSPYV